MCGIAGTLPRAEPAWFEQILNLLAHRGPDDAGTWSDDDVTLGHRRLSILDLSAEGHQPMFCTEGRFVLVFNGEIYNFIELRETLRAGGYPFRSESDSEVILAAYRKWGADCLPRMNGMWAFAIWDRHQKTLFMARDRFGKKPLFYTEAGGRFAFASEMKALLPFLPEVKPSPCFEWMRRNVHAYESTGECLVNGIRRLPAGAYAIWRDGRLTLRKYWESLEHLEPVPARYEEQVERFRDLFVDACRIRMRADVPIGTALSGGLDSSAITCTLAYVGRALAGDRVSRDWQHAFTAAFPGTSFDETAYARAVVEHLGIEATELPIDPLTALDRLDDYFYAFEELYITSPIPMIDTYAGMRRNGVVVSIDGHGADELLAGYAESVFTAYPDCRRLRDVDDVIDTYRGLFGAGAPFEIGSRAHYRWRYVRDILLRPRVMALRTALRGAASQCMGASRVDEWMRRIKGRPAPASADARGKSPVPDGADHEPRHPAFEQLDHFGRHLYILFHETTLPTLLRNFDRYAMANGVEIRMPFLDYRLVCYTLSLPWNAKIRNGYTKKVLRDAVGDLMPPVVRSRRTKIGFGSPTIEWMQRDMKSFIKDTVASRSFRECPVIPDTEALARRIRGIMSDPSVSYRAAEAAWTDLLVYFWYRAMIARPGTVSPCQSNCLRAR